MRGGSLIRGTCFQLQTGIARARSDVVFARTVYVLGGVPVREKGSSRLTEEDRANQSNAEGHSSRGFRGSVRR